MDDQDIRLAALAAARSLQQRWGDAVPFEEIEKGCLVDGERMLLMSRAEGVFKPAALSAGVLSIRSTLLSRYTDERLSDRHTYYEYSPLPGRNERIRVSMQEEHDLIYLLQVKGKPNAEYMVIAPVRVVGDDPATGRFTVDLSPQLPLYDPARLEPIVAPPRLYESATVQVRLFQAHFRKAVLGAYEDRCCVCSLPERPLLDGAHIIPDREPEGEPVIQNGLAMCVLHHRAFDTEILTVDADYKVRVFEERLVHPGDPANRVLLDLHGRAIRLPEDRAMWPDRERLENRYHL